MRNKPDGLLFFDSPERLDSIFNQRLKVLESYQYKMLIQQATSAYQGHISIQPEFSLKPCNISQVFLSLILLILNRASLSCPCDSFGGAP